jgi:hypothetical protein
LNERVRIDANWLGYEAASLAMQEPRCPAACRELRGVLRCVPLHAIVKRARCGHSEYCEYCEKRGAP